MKNLIFLSIFILSALSTHLHAQEVHFQMLTCNYQTNPIAIDSEQPLLSWIVKADGYNREQTAFQILVASKEENLNEKEADFWNSGKVASSQSAHIKYKGNNLNPTQKYFWKVKIWDENGTASTWSQVNTFETGLMSEANWGGAKWISLSEDTRTSEYRFRDYKTGGMKNPVKVTSNPVGYFRNEITANKEIKSARAYVCGLGYYELYINGEKTGHHVLDPAPSNYDKQAYYVAYDVTSQLKTGKNTLGLIVGNGFYGQSISWKNDPESERDMAFGIPAARLLVKVNYTEGTQTEFVTGVS